MYVNTSSIISFDSKFTEYLNEQLAMENAVADRLVARIHETLPWRLLQWNHILSSATQTYYQI